MFGGASIYNFVLAMLVGIASVWFSRRLVHPAARIRQRQEHRVGLGHHRLDERVAHPGAHRRAAALADDRDVADLARLVRPADVGVVVVDLDDAAVQADPLDTASPARSTTR